MMLSLYDSSANRIQLEAKIAVGGEGSIHRLHGRSGVLAKIYSSPPDTISQLKLRELMKIQNPVLNQFSAWPKELLFDSPSRQNAVGFLMTDFGDCILLLDLFADSSRIFHFPQLTWTGMIQIAENIAKAVNIAHKQNLVIGDLHPRNILVNKSAFPRLIDCDSFQITTPQRVFRSVARLPDYLPPELQGVDFGKLDGTPNHDRFGLAMIIFQCLFVGRNPFSGEMDIETAIKHHRYAYGPGARKRGIQPTTDGLQPEHFTPEIAGLFERAFLKVKNRPTANEWMVALTNLRKQLKPCHANRSHSRLASQSTCPFCEMQQETGVELFPNQNAATIVTANSAFVTPPECVQIKGLIFPAVPFPVPPAATIKTTAVLPPKSIEFIRCELYCMVIFLVAALVTCFSSRLGIRPTFPAAIALACAGAAVIARSTSPWYAQVANLRQQCRQHEANANTLETALTNRLQSEDGIFNQLVQEGQNASLIIQHEVTKRIALARTRQRKFEEQERRAWLRRHTIRPLCVRLLTPDQCQQLNAMGLVSAADLLPHRLNNATFLTQKQRRLLPAWADSIRNSFKCPPFRPSLTPGSFCSEFLFYSISTSNASIVRERFAKATAIINGIPSLIAQDVPAISSLRAQTVDANDQILQLRALHKAAYDRTVLASVTSVLFLCAPILSVLDNRKDEATSAVKEVQQIAQVRFDVEPRQNPPAEPSLQVESASGAVYQSEDPHETTPEPVKVQQISFPLPKPLKGSPVKV